MKKWALFLLVLTCLLLAGVVSPAAAQSGSANRDPQFEQQVAERLGKINPDAVSIFQDATVALDADDFTHARAGFERVLALAPGFPDALRRLSQAYYYMNDAVNAQDYARQALAASPAPENKAWLAGILLDNDDPASKAEAYTLAKESVAERPEESYSQFVLMVAAAATDHLDDLHASNAAYLRLAPDEPYGHFYAGLIAANDKKWELAERELLLARDLGADPNDVQGVLDQGIHTQALLSKAGRWALIGFAAWLVGLALLFLAGIILSRVTAASVNRQQGLTSMEIKPAERLMRRLYRVVIAVTSLYFYASIPMMMLLIVAVTAGIFYGFFAIGQIPVKLAIILLLVCLYTLYAIVRSLFVRRSKDDPGKSLSRAESLPLWGLLEETARKVGTRPVDKVFVTAGSEIGVYERGGWLRRLRGLGERCLILGLGALPGMEQGQLRAILAHEYGHFNHADTAGGDLANAVSFNITNMARGLASVGTATWFNPVWLFINGFFRVFTRITGGASRLQEILADRYATVQYGARNMRSGLEHVIRQGILFDAQAEREINLAIQEQRPLRNLYTLAGIQTGIDVDQAYDKAMQATTSPYASHPSPRERLAFIDCVRNSGLVYDDPRPASDLIPGLDRLQDEMTRQVETNLSNQGVLKISS